MERAGPAGRTPGWRLTIGLTLAVLVLRVAYLIWLCPYELAGDEAQYWDWSRRPALSYYTKGPGVAWAIGASTAVFGTREWSVRLPAALATSVGMLAAAVLAAWCAGDRRAGFYAAALYALLPAFSAVGQFMTIDAPMLAAWAVAALAGWWAFESAANDRPSPLAGAAAGLALGIGFLFKYTILLVLPGWLLYGILTRRQFDGGWRSGAVAVLAGACLLLAVSPVLIWNHQHDWVTVAHLLGHLGVSGGDVVARPDWHYDPMWTVELLAGQAGIVGPPLLVLMLLGWHTTRRQRHHEPRLGRAGLYLVCTGVPTLAFYLMVTLVTDGEQNWPLGAYVTLVPLAALALPGQLARYRYRLAAWRADERRPRPRMGWLGRKPETIGQVAWHWAIGYGLVGAVAIAMAPVFLRLPVLRQADWAERAVQRVSHQDRLVAPVQEARDVLRERTGQIPLVIASKYQWAGLLAFYLPDRPVTFSARHALGGRRSSYDLFADTDLTAASLRGRPAVLVGAEADRWARAFRVGGLERHARIPPVYLADRYDGVARRGEQAGGGEP